ncbi:MAG TPA: S46 family peptidase [Candidatus Aminicenantes bacterium]|nr:S46 family peptidase [Candidatus Aminicenantes bacterium]
MGRGAIQNLSAKDKDLMNLGFYARTRGEELRCPGVELRVLQGIEDVTDAITAAEARDKVIAEMEKDFSKKTGLPSICRRVFPRGSRR